MKELTAEGYEDTELKKIPLSKQEKSELVSSDQATTTLN